jgi:DNA-binding MarR family transcriptional regulator
MSGSTAQEAWALFWRLFSADLPRRSAILAAHGLTPMQAKALQALVPEAPLTMSALANQMFCDPSNITGVADRLEAAGLVERRPSAQDRRVKTLVLTPAGERARDAMVRDMSVPPPAIASLSEEDAEQLRAILERALAESGADADADAASAPR